MRGAKQKEMFEISDLRSVCFPPPPGGGVLLYFHAYLGSSYFRGNKILNFNIFGGFQKTEYFGGFQKTKYFWGHEDFVDIFWGHHNLDYTMHFRVFSEGQGTKWKIFFGLLKFQIFIWCA